MDYKDLDLTDIIVFSICLIIVAQNPGFIVVPLFIIWLIQFHIRRSSFGGFLPRWILHNPDTIEKHVPKKIEHWIASVSPSDTQQLHALPEIIAPDDMLKSLPKVAFTDIPYPEEKWMVPVGINYLRTWEWLNIEHGITHALVAGQSGTGKDNLLRLWFTILTRQNPATDLQFAIIDGKGEWLLPPIANSAYMFTQPAGGIDIDGMEDWKQVLKATRASMERVLGEVFKELARRQKMFTEYGVVSRERYIEKSGNKLPLLVLICTDVGTDLEKEVDQLLQIIVSKGRSLGIRAIISMQTPTGQSTLWRTNVSVVITGRQQQGSQDNPVMGTHVKDMLIRPSQLPDPKERPGVMIMRRGDYQIVVQCPYFPESFWENYVESLPRNYRGMSDKFLLEDLLAL